MKLLRLCIWCFILYLIFAAADSHAGELILPDGTQPTTYQRWVDRSAVPTPDTTIELDLGNCPGSVADVAGCTWPGGPIWMNPAWASRLVLMHEVGHQFDYLMMNDYARNQFRIFVGDGRPWRTPPDSPHEKFAEAYALCSVARTSAAYSYQRGVYHYMPTWRRHRRICMLIRHTAAIASAAAP